MDADADAASYVQIVFFRLLPGVDVDAFLKASDDMLAWLKQQNGFEHYELYRGEDGWADRLVWRDRKCAESGLRRFVGTELGARMIGMVEADANAFFGATVLST